MVLGILGIYANAYTVSEPSGSNVFDFGIRSPSEMPKIDGCSSQFDAGLYYSGLAAGVDPVFLKSIMYMESRGNPNVKENHNSDGSIDYGIMQINSKGLSKLGITNPKDLETNYLLNIWAATEIVKWKYALVKSMVNTSYAGYTVEDSPLSIFWAYNGMDKYGKGHEYGVKAYNIYSKARSQVAFVPQTETNITNLFILTAYAGSYRLSDVVTNPNTMTYDEFSSMVQKISAGEIVPQHAGVDNAKRASLQQILADERTALGLVGVMNKNDVVINYDIYNGVEMVLRGINTIGVVMSYMITVLLVLLWVMWILNKAGVYFSGEAVNNITNGKLDFQEEGSMSKLIGITITILTITALVVSGLILEIMQKVLLFIASFFSR